MKNLTRLILAETGFGFAAHVMAAIGALDLARVHTGKTRLGARIACYGFVAQIGLSVLWAVISSHREWIFDHSTMWEVLVYVWMAVSLVPVVGFAIATERLVIAILACVVGVAMAPPPFLEKLVFDALAIGEHKLRLAQELMELVHVVVIAVLVVIAARTEAITEVPEDAVRGFRHASYALTMRVVAVVIVPLATLMLMGTRSSSGGAEDAQKLLQYGTIGAVIIGFVSTALFGVGVLQLARARVPDLSRVLALLGATCALWCAGVMLEQGPKLVQVTFAHDSFEADFASSYVTTFSVLEPLVEIASIALVVGVIVGFANKRLVNELHTQATGKGIGFVILMGISLAMQLWLLPEARTDNSAMFLRLAAVGCAVWGTVLMAQLCYRAGETLDTQTNLPKAKLV